MKQFEEKHVVEEHGQASCDAARQFATEQLQEPQLQGPDSLKRGVPSIAASDDDTRKPIARIMLGLFDI
jgi:hypothetical protein